LNGLLNILPLAAVSFFSADFSFALCHMVDPHLGLVFFATVKNARFMPILGSIVQSSAGKRVIQRFATL
jgi:hypothetical protein